MSLLWRKLAFHPSNSFCICRSIKSSFVSSFRQCTFSSPISTNKIHAETAEEFFLEPSNNNNIKPEQKISILEELPDLPDISHIGPPIDYKSFNFAAYANESVVLQKLIDLGVDFYMIEKTFRTCPDYLLQLDFNKHIQPYIQFLLDRNILIEKLGVFFTKNPFFFQNHLDDLQVRINYLQSKKFTNEMITGMLLQNPKLLNFNTVFIDSRLGYFQREFELRGFEVRMLASKYSPIITISQKRIFPVICEMKTIIGFTKEECKSIILKQPYVLKVDQTLLKRRLEFMTLDMELPLSLIAADPSGLVNRTTRLRERHLFLKSLRRAQYNPSQPNYVSITSITHGDDATFCERVAKTSVETYNIFLKTL